jgi:hypothetical protein
MVNGISNMVNGWLMVGYWLIDGFLVNRWLMVTGKYPKKYLVNGQWNNRWDR